MGRNFGMMGQAGMAPTGGRFGGPPTWPHAQAMAQPQIGFPALMQMLQRQALSGFRPPTAATGPMAQSFTPAGPQPPGIPGPNYGQGGERRFFPNFQLDFSPPAPVRAPSSVRAPKPFGKEGPGGGKGERNRGGKGGRDTGGRAAGSFGRGGAGARSGGGPGQNNSSGL